MNNEYNNEIDLIDLFWKILYSWRAIVIVMVVGAVVIGFGKYASDIRSVAESNAEALKEAQAEAEADAEDKKTLLEDEMTQTELNAVLEAANIYKTLVYKQDYYDKSIYMNIDPNSRYTTYLWYRVELAPEEIQYTSLGEVSSLSTQKLNGLTDLYKNYTASKGMQEGLEGILGEDVDVKYITELMSSGVSTTGVVYIAIMGKNAVQTEIVAAKADELMQQYTDALKAAICNHTLTKVDEYTNTIADTALASTQESYRSAIISLKKNLATLAKEFDTQQEKLYEEYIKENVIDFDSELPVADENVESAQTTDDTDNTVSVELKEASLRVTNFLLGAVAGLVLCAGWIVFVYVCSGRINSAEEMQDNYRIRVLGNLSMKPRKKKTFSCVDSFLDKLRKKEDISIEEQKHMLLTNVRLLLDNADNADIKSILLTSAGVLTDAEREVTDEIRAVCKEKNVELMYEDGLTRNAAAVEKLSKSGNVIMITRLGEDTCKSVRDELRIVKEQNAKVLGTVCIG